MSGYSRAQFGGVESRGSTLTRLDCPHPPPIKGEVATFTFYRNSGKLNARYASHSEYFYYLWI